MKEINSKNIRHFFLISTITLLFYKIKNLYIFIQKIMEEKYQDVNNKANIEPKNIDTSSGSSLYKKEKLDKFENNNTENDEINNNENINDNDDKKNISKKCCDFLCNKLFHSNKRSKNFYMKGWREYLEREGNLASDKPFKILTNLFVNDEEAILGLESIRLNPNLVSENKLRNDLEFYIPQLCTFLLFGEMKDIEEFFVFLCKACNLSFFFAHRVHWFLSAMIEASQEKKENIIQILKMINTLFKSENEENKIKLNNFYVSNSEEYIHFIKINNLHFLYNNKNIQKDHVHLIEEFDIENLRGQQLNIYNKYSKAKNIIFKYSEKEYEYAILQNTNISSKDKNINKNDTNEIINLNEDIKKEKNKIKFKEKLNANEFLISISNFKLNRIDYSFEDDDNELKNNSENNIPEEEEKKNKNEKIINKTLFDINFESYHSSLNFIEHLCDICSEMTKYNSDFQKKFLFNKLLEINKQLPFNVYLPFLRESTRNYIICHIPLSGVKIFRTKTSCPILLTFELIRIDEVNRAIKEEENNQSINFSYSQENEEYNEELTFLEQKINSSYDKNFFSSTDYDLSKPLIISKKCEEMKEKDQKRAGLENNINKNKYQSLKIKLFSFQGKTKIDNSKNIYDKDLEEEPKYVNYVNKFIKRPSRSINFNFDEKEKKKEKDDYETKKIMKSAKFSTSKNIIDEKKKLTEKLLDNEEIPEERINTKNQKEKKSQLKVNTSENMQMNIEEDYNNKPISIQELKNIFGENFSKNEKELKKKSLFGKLNTYKIFKCIIKTNEDLRQEQFATQLINEFYQIFKLENSDCWLNTYEIISTGNNCGLVEFVKDSLSLDQLKQKTNNMPLKDFYINYFGNGDEESLLYKKAMNNFIASLAGYSLVCYFLQIKDRHNGNILIDNEGHIIHIDFGYLLSNAPGKGLKFENAPFKLNNDMLELLGGVKGKYFLEFRKLLQKGFLAVHKHRSKITILVEMMWCGHGKNLGCFEGGQDAIDELKNRLNPKDYTSKVGIQKFVDNLIGQSIDNWRTKWYDIFQYYVQGIFY